jgi:hypothetical protein
MDNELFKLFPYDIIIEIWDRIDPTVKLVLDKKNYNKHHSILYDKLSYNDKLSYQNCMIKNDDGFVFETILLEYGNFWNTLSIYAGGIHHRSYLIYLYTLIYENNANKCSAVMDKYINGKGKGLCKNRYKNFHTNNIRWNN